MACRVGGPAGLCLIKGTRNVTRQGTELGRVLEADWSRKAGGGASRLGYLRLCSIVADCVFQLVWLRRRGTPTVHCTFFVVTIRSFFWFCLFVKMSFSCDQSLDGSFPPSPAEDRGSKRLSWGSLLQKLTELKGTSQRATADPCSRSETGECCRLLSFFWGC